MSPALCNSLLELTGKITFHCDQLLRDYQPLDLHQFRVNTRRNRSLLKQMKSSAARDFMKAWGGFFAITNQARDWDVFRETSSVMLSPEQYIQFEKLLLPRTQASHDMVLQVLQSTQWRRHLANWQRFLAGLESDQIEVPPGLLSKVMKKSRKVCKRALQTGDDFAWHKFRIAVKNVRYIAEQSTRDPEFCEGELSKVIDACKILQTHLGDWHDTVVQLQLISGPEYSAELDTTPELAEVKTRLVDQLQERKRHLLAQVQEALVNQKLFTG